MYPTFADLLNDLLGTSFCLPIQTFGFFVALAFISAWATLRHELIRKSKSGLFPQKTIQVSVGGPIPTSEIGYSILIWGIMGYKLGLVFTQNNLFCDSPQAAILSIQGDPIIAAIAAALGGILKYREYQQKKNHKAEIKSTQTCAEYSLGTVTTLAGIGGLIGAKLFHNLENLDDFMQDPIRALISFDGLTFYGGLILGSAAVIYYLRKEKIPLLPYIDAAAPALMLAYGVGRLGCQLSGDGDWGIVNLAPKPSWLSWAPDWAWASTYPHNVIREGIPITDCIGKFCFELPQPVFPTPLYEVLMGITLAGFLWSLRNRIKIPGQLFAIYLFVNGMERFLIEKIRVNTTIQISSFSITQAEFISSVLMLFGIILFIRLNKKKSIE